MYTLFYVVRINVYVIVHKNTMWSGVGGAEGQGSGGAGENISPHLPRPLSPLLQSIAPKYLDKQIKYLYYIFAFENEG